METLEGVRILTEQLQRVAEEIGKITKRLDGLDEKLDNYHMETIQAKNDIAWIKGSGKILVTVLITVTGALITAFIKLIPSMHP